MLLLCNNGMKLLAKSGQLKAALPLLFL